MKWSRYNIYVPYKGGTIIYNSRTYQIGYIDGTPESANGISTLAGLDGILVPENVDEVELMREHLRKRFDADKIFRVELMITQKCNLACSYCYQSLDNFKRIDMQDSIVDASITFINALEYPTTVTFYGGEPLLQMSKIEYFCKHLTNVARYSIITNGINLNYAVAERLVQLGITHCQITIDGLAQDHNKLRKFPNGDGTYDIILQNIIEALPTGLRITIRTNVSNQSKQSLQEFFLAFYKSGLYKKVSFSISDVIGNDVNQEDIIKSLFYRFIRMGFDINCPITVPCQIGSGKSFVIDSEGYIYPCMFYAGVDSGRSVGHVLCGINAEKLQPYKDLSPWDNCLHCNYVGICAGGCRVRGTKPNEKYCQKKLLSFIQSEEIKLAYTRLIGS